MIFASALEEGNHQKGEKRRQGRFVEALFAAVALLVVVDFYLFVFDER